MQDKSLVKSNWTKGLEIINSPLLAPTQSRRPTKIEGVTLTESRLTYPKQDALLKVGVE